MRIRPRSDAGFTLIELMIVMMIIGILITIAEPTYRTQIIRARETALKKDLFIVRDVIDQYAADQGHYPDSLQELVEKGYLRAIPVDPFTRASDTWVEVHDTTGEDAGGVFDIHSGSDLVGLDETPYNLW